MIIHADMDAFYASVEIRERPELRGKPVVVAGRPDQRGVVSAASYEARKYGIHSAMPTVTALKRCPDLVVLPGHMVLYSEVSHQIHSIFARYTPLIEPLALDEAFLDVTASKKLFGSATDIAQRIKQDIVDELQLAASLGIAPNKFLAKIASDLEKPNGFVVVNPDNVQAFLDPLPVSRLWGVGKVTEQRLHRLGIATVADLRQCSLAIIRQHFSQQGEHLWQLAHGQDNRPVITDYDAKSISHETTFAQDIDDSDILRAVLLNLTEQVAWRLRQHNYRGRTVQLKLRFDNFHTITRSHSLAAPTQVTRELWDTALNLLNKALANSPSPIRLIGVGVSGFQQKDTQQQLGMFDEPRSTAKMVDKITDDVNTRFGSKLLSRARTIQKSH